MNIFTQIGFVVLVGLASKNAILIVEFAKHQRQDGQSRREATLNACKLRLRPIVMTSLAFILGVLPLMALHGGQGRDAADAGNGPSSAGCWGHAVRHCLDAGLFLYDRPAGRVALVRFVESATLRHGTRPHQFGFVRRPAPASPAHATRAVEKSSRDKNRAVLFRTPPSNVAVLPATAVTTESETA